MTTQQAAQNTGAEDQILSSVELLAEIEKKAAQAAEEYKEYMAPYNEAEESGEEYDEDFDDTLERKYAEGYADALALILGYLNKHLPPMIEKQRNDEAVGVLQWLEEIYGEGIRETGAWQAYCGDEDEEENN